VATGHRSSSSSSAGVLAITWAAEHCAAILLAWVPGEAGPDAIASVLAGDEDPGGRLPVSIPRHVGQLPLSYRHHPTGGRSHCKGPYVDGPTTPLWPFGSGRSYAAFELSGLRLDRTSLATDGGSVTVSVEIVHVAGRCGEEVVQLYARDEEASVARPVLELRGFRRVRLGAGERRRVTFTLDAEQFAHRHRPSAIIEPGASRYL
jgi:beta-glucosidase